jgi:hypothetical protein
MCHWLRVLLRITELDLSPGVQSYLVVIALATDFARA